MKKNWEIKKLGEVCQIKGGKRIPKGKKLLTEKTLHPYIRVTDFTDDGTVSLNDIHYISDEIYETIKQYTITTSDVFISIAGTIGKVGVIPSELNNANLTENACKLILNDKLYNKYLVYVFQSDKIKAITQDNARANAMPKLSITRLSNIAIPVPPLEEQKHIVKILDEKFAQLETIKANAQTNLQNAKDLFQSQLTKAFSNTTWEKKRLDEITTIINGYAFPSKDFSKTNTVKSIKITNVGVGTFIEDDDEKLPSDYLFTKTEVMVYSKDLVIALTRTIISDGLKIAFVPESFNNALVNQRVAAMRPIETQVLANLLYYFFKTDIAYNYVLEHVNTLMQPNLSIGDLKSFPIPLPPLPEQKRIVKELDALSEKTKALQNIYEKMLLDCEELKQSYLCKAFAGEL